MRRILLAGKTGQIGWELRRTLATIGEVVGVNHNDMDLADPDAIRKVIREIKPEIIVNAAAYTAVASAIARHHVGALIWSSTTLNSSFSLAKRRIVHRKFFPRTPYTPLVRKIR